jgi:hypothetical protein
MRSVLIMRSAGIVESQLQDADDILDEEDDEPTPKNFSVRYDEGPYDHLLHADNYADSIDDDEGSWLIVQPAKGGKAKRARPSHRST